MSDASPIDANNNDGTSACRVTSYSHCCDSTNSAHHSALSPNKIFYQAQPPLNGTNSLSSLQSCINHLSLSVEPLKATALLCEQGNGTSKPLFFLQKASQKDSDESSSEKENKLKVDFTDETKPLVIKFPSKSAPRGILKYPPGWRRRAISESSAMICSTSSNSDDSSLFGTSLDSPDILFEFEDDCIEDDGLDKPKKNVTFSDKMATFVFRPNSSILGRRLKNQKKAKKKKEKKLRDSLENLPSDGSFMQFKDEVEAAQHFIALQRAPLDSFDSNSDISSSSGCDCSASDCSGDEAPAAEVLNKYEDESKTASSKTNRNNRRKRNRRNKQTVRTNLETGGYDSDY